MWREFFKPIIERSKGKPMEFSDYFRHSIENRASALFLTPVGEKWFGTL